MNETVCLITFDTGTALRESPSFKVTQLNSPASVVEPVLCPQPVFVALSAPACMARVALSIAG